MAGKFEIFKDRALFKFQLTDDNDAVLVVSPGYSRKEEAVAAIMAVRENAAAGHIVDKSVLDDLTAEKSFQPVVPVVRSVRENRIPARRRGHLVAPQG